MTRRGRFAAAVAVLSVIGLVGVVDPHAEAQVLPSPTTTTTTAPPPPPPPPTLQRGDNNGDVQAVQHRLKDLAYDPGAQDGTFRTRHRVRGQSHSRRSTA